MRLTLTIESLASGGEGMGRAGGRLVFVPFTVPGDRVVAEVPAPGGEDGDPGKGAAHATLVELLAPGPARVAAPCAHSGTCGGCEWQQAAYAVQLETKTRTLATALQRIGGLEPGSYALRPILPSPEPYRYRARAKLHLDRAAGLVFFARRSHQPVPLQACHLLVPGLEALRAALGPALLAARLPAREVALEWSDAEGRGAALIRLPEVTAALRTRAEAVLAAVPALAGLVLQAEDAPVALVGDPVLRLSRAPGLPAAGLQRTRPDMFQQANRGANAVLVAEALRLLAPEGEDVLELYCGAGNFTGPLAARARAVAAVEVQGPALELARADAVEQQRGSAGASPEPGVRFYAGDALKLALALARERGPSARRFGAALLDPPREGARGVGPALRELGVARAVYVSCDPATLARDLRACVAAGFRVATVVPIDMFPQTHHVEGVALLERG